MLYPRRSRRQHTQDGADRIVGSVALRGGQAVTQRDQQGHAATARRACGTHALTAVLWLIVFFVCGVLSEIVGLAWQPVGAGNSIANFGLAASVAVWCLASSQQWPARIIAAVALLAGVPLLLLQDIHGAATLIGTIVGVVLLAMNRRRMVEQ